MKKILMRLLRRNPPSTISSSEAALLIYSLRLVQVAKDESAHPVVEIPTLAAGALGAFFIEHIQKTYSEGAEVIQALNQKLKGIDDDTNSK